MLLNYSSVVFAHGSMSDYIQARVSLAFETDWGVNMKSRYLGVAVSLSLLTLMSAPANAYLDPGTGSIILQAIIASVVVGFASMRFWWDRLLSLLGLRKQPKPSESAADTEAKNRERKDNS
jgi:hypothetical protein